MDKPKYRIDILNTVGLIVVALIFDAISGFLGLIEYIPILGTIIAWPLALVNNLTAWIAFGIWFLLLGIGFINPKRFATALVTILIGFFPFLYILPELTIAVIATIIFVRLEDKGAVVLGVGKNGQAKAKFTAGKPPFSPQSGATTPRRQFSEVRKLLTK